MDGELRNFIEVWISAIASLCYCYYVASRLPKGFLRFLCVLPVLCIFIILPLNLAAFHLVGVTSFFLAWLANFKLLLFCFDRGPLVSPPPSHLFHFISLACLPIKFKSKINKQSSPSPKPSPSETNFISAVARSLLLALKIALVVILFRVYEQKPDLNKNVIMALYCLHAYLELEIVLALSAIPVRILFGFEIEPQFNEPYLATSLQDFWGRRWNLMVTSILRPTVYDPIRQLSSRIFRSTWAPFPAVMVSFLVSGFMHELIYYYLTRAPPTWEVTWFFVLHGICTAVEVAVKKAAVARGWRLHRAVSGPLTVGFVAVTGVWLFFPQLVRNGMDEQAITEFRWLVDFVKVNSSWTPKR